MLTTLTTALVLPLADSDRFVTCICNVGDSLSYVYSAQHGVREITKGEYIYLLRFEVLMQCLQSCIMETYRWLPTFKRNVLPPSSGCYNQQVQREHIDFCQNCVPPNLM